MMNIKYNSEIFASLHETMQGLHDAGAIDKVTMRSFDKSYLTPIEPLDSKQNLFRVSGISAHLRE